MKVTLRILAVTIAAILLLTIPSCQQSPTDPTTVQQVSNSPRGSLQKVTVMEDFELGTKTAYAIADVTFGSGVWSLDEALVGTSASDPKNGTKSIRTRNSGKLTMKFNRTDGAGVVTVNHAKYGSDANTTWQLWYSINSGTSWTQTGSTITTSSTTLSSASFTVNITGTIRFEIRKTDGTTNRVNFDNFTINDYAAAPTVTEVEPNNTTATANPVGAVPATQTGLVSATTDIDFFSLSATSTQTITLGLTVPAGVNYDLLLLNSAGTTVASSANAAGVSESISYNSTTNESYYIEVLSTSGSSTTTAYTLTANLSTYGGGGGGTDTSTSTSVHLTMGNPSYAVTLTSSPTNYKMEKPQYVLSYHRDKGTANWVAWHLNASWIGSTARQDDFRADATLPAGWYQVGSTSYSGSGYDRGHMCPSADRTKNVADNSATFLMTNMVPQAPNNNQGPWASMENYLRTLVTAGKELYIYSGGYGSQGTINSGHVNVPTNTWKIVVVLDEGTNDLGRVTTTTRVIAVNMPNSDALISRTADWKTFRVSVDAIEAATGYDFLGKVSPAIQTTIESVVDNL